MFEPEYDCGCEPDRAFLKLVMTRFGLEGDFWERMLIGAMGGDPACAAHVLAHCEKQQGEKI